MLNQVILVGKVIQQYKENDDTMILLRIANTPPTTRGSSDEECDLVPCRIGPVFKELEKHLILGATLGVKAKITTYKDSDKLTIDAQKITFISNRGDEDE
jgi:single-stranded DNA-binding protein